MILLLFYEMKLLAFIGDFFTPMLPLLLFFYSSLHYSLLLCPAPLFCFFFLLSFIFFMLYPLFFCSLSLGCPCPVLVSFLF
ncbi:hypothetical protein PPACK8108_LOCUS20451, partial [Phakopsora pachyrhizi]